MRERPILFNTEMVKAILDGRKTCTRRIVKGYIPKNGEFGYTAFTPQNAISCRGTFETNYQEYGEKFFKLPYQKGDVLYVRETWSTHYEPDKNGKAKLEYCYKADGINLKAKCLPGETNKWYPSIHMPKEAARIWLKVTNVRVERVQEMEKLDAVKEGIDPRLCVNLGHALSKFKKLWNSIINKSDLDTYGWDANPYVWVIEFERYEKPRKWGLRMGLIDADKL